MKNKLALRIYEAAHLTSSIYVLEKFVLLRT